MLVFWTSFFPSILLQGLVSALPDRANPLKEGEGDLVTNLTTSSQWMILKEHVKEKCGTFALISEGVSTITRILPWGVSLGCQSQIPLEATVRSGEPWGISFLAVKGRPAFGLPHLAWPGNPMEVLGQVFGVCVFSSSSETGSYLV